VIHTLERTITVDAPLDDVFSFFQDPRNLAGITPAWMGFDLVHVDGGEMRSGFKIVYRIRWLGVGLRWVTRIREYDPPNRFVDVQTSGPYRTWRHEHTFAETASGTRMRDVVRYQLPFGILGDVAHRLIVQRQLRRIFDYRADRIAELFGRRDTGPAGPP
jgi:ligand-binding SRPBCC domain-containing protein